MARWRFFTGESYGARQFRLGFLAGMAWSIIVALAVVGLL